MSTLFNSAHYSAFSRFFLSRSHIRPALRSSVLGRGGFGKVMQVRHTTSGHVYAMKVLKKKELIRRKQVERTKTERHILEKAAGHPFVVSLAYAFQTKYKLYMVMDFVQGGDFFTFLRKMGKMRESWAKLYICEIGESLPVIDLNKLAHIQQNTTQ